ncbi:sugar kinase [Halobacillus sp. BBL2006]|uniref:sugar kinase n=1 Tax=Halobacillus sp. BBL2006 TaxID=1543706 RepID=UPI000541F998|nr:sugar kinase [Halobacillus sp. BBL2006]KHE66935.1 2-dehydro-3-deoxygluconokinase [Halobacillus sp. BBL2006]
MKSLDVVTLGETMVLFSPQEQMPLEYVHQMQKQIAGAESNVAIGLSRLGHKTGWISKLGEDPFGRYIHKFIRGEGVDTSAVTYTEKAPTGLIFKEKLTSEHVNVYYYRHMSAASTMSPSDLNDTYLTSAKVLHVTGITPALSETCKEAVFHAIRTANDAGMTVVFDPNIRYKLWENHEDAREVLLEIASLSDIIMPGVEEAAFLTEEEEYKKAAEHLLTRDEQTVIIKLGAEGAYYANGKDHGFVPGFAVQQVIDPVGAGDGFAAGVISGVLEGSSIADAVKKGNAVGAFVVQMNGDFEGVPSHEQLDSFMHSGGRQTDVER